ncbi:hypothetical protein KGF56_000412 [Candida oxycetoniae]|uniref:RGS domain-containing protein n=1 Tax=Candida oxycetoniae TaxID=497107 RepID=A0AAI9T1B6_9ASCO|nr:uncharacterized protein KGF56_000412 [Candida oxycetoniae]KAI3406807.2 hypothetical protein KGF56_000412 [Candida oxycetoniae]
MVRSTFVPVPTQSQSYSKTETENETQAQAQIPTQDEITFSPKQFPMSLPSLTESPIPTRSIDLKSLNASLTQHNQHFSETETETETETEIPSKTTASSIKSKPSSPPCNLPSLDQLVNDCFLLSIDKLSNNQEYYGDNDALRIAMAKNFHDFLNRQHCQENLDFLIDIYRYEYLFNLKFYPMCQPEASGLSLNAISNTISTSESLYKSNKVSSKRDSISSVVRNSSSGGSRNRSDSSFDSLSRPFNEESLLHDPSNAFVSTIDDLDMTETWKTFGSKQIDDTPELESDTEDEGNSIEDPVCVSREDIDELNLNWSIIMNTYIKQDSPLQINISQKLFKEIVEENSINKLHHPMILLKAKKEVLRMLKENGYFEFMSQYKKQLMQKRQQEQQQHQQHQQQQQQSQSQQSKSHLQSQQEQQQQQQSQLQSQLQSPQQPSQLREEDLCNILPFEPQVDQIEKQSYFSSRASTPISTKSTPLSLEMRDVADTADQSPSLFTRLSFFPRKNKHLHQVSSPPTPSQHSPLTATSSLPEEEPLPLQSSSSFSSILGHLKFNNNYNHSSMSSHLDSSLLSKTSSPPNSVPVTTCSPTSLPTQKVYKSHQSHQHNFMPHTSSSSSSHSISATKLFGNSNSHSVTNSPQLVAKQSNSGIADIRSLNASPISTSSSKSQSNSGASLNSSFKFWKKRTL